jgi:hypothetical protein
MSESGIGFSMLEGSSIESKPFDFRCPPAVNLDRLPKRSSIVHANWIYGEKIALVGAPSEVEKYHGFETVLRIAAPACPVLACVPLFPTTRPL